MRHSKGLQSSFLLSLERQNGNATEEGGTKIYPRFYAEGEGVTNKVWGNNSLDFPVLYQGADLANAKRVWCSLHAHCDNIASTESLLV